jgi:hypothetical protein
MMRDRDRGKKGAERLFLVVVARDTKSDPVCVEKVVELTLWEGHCEMAKRFGDIVTLCRLGRNACCAALARVTYVHTMAQAKKNSHPDERLGILARNNRI